MPASLSLNGDERLPLLQPPQSPPSAETDHDSSQSTTSLKAYLARAETHILFGVFALQFLASFAKHVIEVPFIALIQRTICVKYYRSHDGNHRDHLLFVAAEEIAEKLCKVVPVQNKLATVTGYKFAFDALPGNHLYPSSRHTLIDSLYIQRSLDRHLLWILRRSAW